MPEEHLDKSYLDRKYFIDSKVYNCPFCNRRNVSYTLTEHLKFDWSAEKECHVYVAECSSCNRQSMHLSFDNIRDPHYWTFAHEIEDIDSHIFYSVPTSFFTVDNRIPRIIKRVDNRSRG